jgi:hypothetical protein
VRWAFLVGNPDWVGDERCGAEQADGDGSDQDRADTGSDHCPWRSPQADGVAEVQPAGYHKVRDLHPSMRAERQ